LHAPQLLFACDHRFERPYAFFQRNGRIGFYRRIGNIEWLPAYVGMSMEYGNVYEERDDISLATDNALLAASIFLGVDTVVGPVYLGYGHAEQGHDSVYLFLGRLF